MNDFYCSGCGKFKDIKLKHLTPAKKNIKKSEKRRINEGKKNAKLYKKGILPIKLTE